jgi:hypothetical protein
MRWLEFPEVGEILRITHQSEKQLRLFLPSQVDYVNPELAEVGVLLAIESQ